MSTKIKHYSKSELLQYVEMDLFVDEMIAIDRHLDECTKCREKASELKSKGGANLSLGSPKVYATVVVVLVIIGAMWWSKSLFKSNENQAEEVNIGLTDSLLLDSNVMVKDVLLMESIDFDSSDLVSDEEKVLIQSMDESVQEKPQVKSQAKPKTKPQPLIVKPVEDKVVNGLKQISSVTQDEAPPKGEFEENKDPIQQEKEESIELVVEEEVVYAVSYKLTLTIMEDQSATPSLGLSRFNQDLNAQVDLSELKLETGDLSEVVLTFEIDEKGRPLKLVLNACSRQAYCDAIISYVKSKSNWSSYVSEDFVEYKTAKVKVAMVTY
ncbi:MAG: hypothetical protein OCD76_00985 [Reichenbachiella sp.]